MDGKELMEKTEKFAKRIISIAADEGLTVRELYGAVDMVKRIADNSTVEWEAVEKTDFPSQHIIVPASESVFDVSDD